MAKKKRAGHYCKICGERKANEKFTGKGHRMHICKDCKSLPSHIQSDMRRIQQLEGIVERWRFSPNDLALLENYSRKHATKDSGRFAKSILDELRTTPDFDDMEDFIWECEFQIYMNDFLKGN